MSLKKHIQQQYALLYLPVLKLCVFPSKMGVHSSIHTDSDIDPLRV